MAALLRVLKRKNRWPAGDPLPWLDPDDVAADPLESLATDNNGWSVYLVGDNDQARIDRVLAGIVAGKENIDTTEYIVLDDSWVLASGIRITDFPGKTPDAEVNTWHRNLTEISAKRLAALATFVVPGCSPVPKLAKAMTEVLARSVMDNHIPLSGIKWTGKSREGFNRELESLRTSH